MGRTDGSAHWYVAIICNLDQAKPRKDPKPPRTRSQVNRPISPDPEPELMPIDLENEEPRHSTPTLAIDPGDGILEISIVEERPHESVVDKQEDMDRNFNRMSISNDHNDSQKELNLDDESRMEIENLITEEKQYTRESTTIRQEGTITLDDDREEEEPVSITSALRRKYVPSTTKTTTRR